MIGAERVPEKQESLREAATAYFKLAQDHPANGTYRQSLAEIYGALVQVLGNSSEIVQIYAAALAEWPDDPHLRVGRGRAFIRLGQPDKALTDFNRAIETTPSDNVVPWWLLDRAIAHSALKQDDKALAELSQATERWPKLWDTWVWRGNYYRARAQWDNAVADYSKALEINPSYWPGWYARAFCNGGQQRWEQAIVDYNKAIELGATDANVHNNLAWLLATCPDLKLRDAARAVQLAMKAVDMAPRAGPFWNTLGAAHYRAGDWMAAIDALEKGMKFRQGGDAFDWFFLAMAHWKLGNVQESRKCHEQAVQWMDEHAPHDEELGRFRAEAAELLGVGVPSGHPDSAHRPDSLQPFSETRRLVKFSRLPAKSFSR